MQADIFRDILVPVIGGLGLFMLGLEFMSNGIQALAVNKMRAVLARVAGTPVTGLMAGTFITGVLQSSTAMTVMTVGLVNAGVMGLRPAISVIMGANIGTTIGNGLIALPLGPLGLMLGGFFALVYVFAKSEKVKNLALACMGFALIFYGLNLLTGGLRPLRGIPEVMSAISSLKADSYLGLAYCILTAAFITALIHSSSATIGIVMGLGAAGVLEWQTAVAFSLGADLGTTITSWMASWNLSKNAKRAAYAHITFNVVGVLVMFPLFFVSMQLLVWAMGWFGGDPGVAVMVNGKETFPLVPVAVGLYSTAFNIFNTALMFPFISVFDRVLSRIGATDKEDIEDYSLPRYLDPNLNKEIATGVTAVQHETDRYLEAAGKFLAMARGVPGAPDDPEEHYVAIDVLSREIRSYTAAMFKPEMPHAQADLLASLIEEEDWTASLGETLYQIARRVQRQQFSEVGRPIVNETIDAVATAMRSIVPDGNGAVAPALDIDKLEAAILALRDRCLRLGAELSWAERGAILTLLGSAERAFYLINRIVDERQSVSRELAQRAERPKDAPLGGMQPAPVPA